MGASIVAMAAGPLSGSVGTRRQFAAGARRQIPPRQAGVNRAERAYGSLQRSQPSGPTLRGP